MTQPNSTALPFQTSKELAEEFPTLWALAVTHDENERIGKKNTQLQDEAADVLHQLWLAREIARSETGL